METVLTEKKCDYSAKSGSKMNIVLTEKKCECLECGVSTGHWTWSCAETDEHWCHNCHVELHGIEFHCPACDEDVKSIQWGNDEKWCDRCEQELMC